jgi:hypothetical protein
MVVVMLIMLGDVTVTEVMARLGKLVASSDVKYTKPCIEERHW